MNQITTGISYTTCKSFAEWLPLNFMHDQHTIGHPWHIKFRGIRYGFSTDMAWEMFLNNIKPEVAVPVFAEWADKNKDKRTGRFADIWKLFMETQYGIS